MAPGRRLRKCGPAFAVASIAALMPAATADAAVTAAASCTPTAFTFPGAGQMSCTVNVQTGDAVEKFSLGANVPVFSGGNSRVGEGPTIFPAGPPVLNGPGTFLGGSITQASVEEPIPERRGQERSTIRCSEVGGTHGFFGAAYANSYSVPANTATSFTQSFGFAQPPWPGDSIAPTFVLQAYAPGGSTLPADIALPIPEPVRLGQSGVRIAFNASPATGGPLSGPPREFEIGRAFTLFGTTDPVAARQVVRIFVMRSTKKSRGKVATLAKVRTDRRGRFALRKWRPDKAGFYEVGVTYRSQQANLADDFACSKWFELVK